MNSRDTPFGIICIQKLAGCFCPRLHFNRELCFRFSVLFLTYLAYMCYHMSRKPISVVKAVLHQNCSSLNPPSDIPPARNSTWCDWAPFDGSDAQASQLLGQLDSAFLFAYAGAMFVSGFVAERVNLRYFLAFGMLFSGIFSYLFGIAKTYHFHDLWYFIIVQGMAGIVQTTGWPGVVSVVGNWFGKSKRGLIFGIWNSHTSIGNILGSLVAGAYVEYDWSLSFIIPGLIMGIAGFIIFLFLVSHPSDVGCISPNNTERKKYKRLKDQASGGETPSTSNSDAEETESLIEEQLFDRERKTKVIELQFNTRRTNPNSKEVQRRISERTYLLPNNRGGRRGEQAIGFFGALKIPGVVEFSFSLFFAKLVSYTFLYWLPLYVHTSTTMSATLSADLSTLFDVGGIAGAIAAGFLSDCTNMPAATCAVMLILAIPGMFVYQHFGALHIGLNVVLLIIVGFLVNGPYALITTSVSAELGTHSSLEGNSKALATVTAIIDGTGSIGAAVGPLLAGYVQSQYSWRSVFIMLMLSDVFALVLLLRLVRRELSWFKQRRREERIE